MPPALALLALLLALAAATVVGLQLALRRSQASLDAEIIQLGALSEQLVVLRASIELQQQRRIEVAESLPARVDR